MRTLSDLSPFDAAALGAPSGEVAFGIPPSPRALIAVPLLKRFARSCPRVMIRVVEETSGQLRDLIASGVLDVAVTNAHEPSQGVVSQPLGRDQMVLVGPRYAKLSMQKETPIEMLAELPLILTTRPNSLRLIVEAGLSARGLRSNVCLEANTLPLMTDLVIAGFGYTVLPACGIRLPLKERAFSASPIKDFYITWLVAKPKTRSLGVAGCGFRRSRPGITG
jgi:LysR family nitrogen assimilation transcriptional regulator